MQDSNANLHPELQSVLTDPQERREKKKGENSKYLGGGEIRLRSVAAMMGTILFLFSWEWKTISSSSLILRPPKVRR